MASVDELAVAENSETSGEKETSITNAIGSKPIKNELDEADDSGEESEAEPQFNFVFRGKTEVPGAGSDKRSTATRVKPDKKGGSSKSQGYIDDIDELDERATKAKLDKKNK